MAPDARAEHATGKGAQLAAENFCACQNFDSLNEGNKSSRQRRRTRTHTTERERERRAREYRYRGEMSAFNVWPSVGEQLA
jgi:hypothetical protein